MELLGVGDDVASLGQYETGKEVCMAHLTEINLV
jgi:hypothetical protein